MITPTNFITTHSASSGRQTEEKPVEVAFDWNPEETVVLTGPPQAGKTSAIEELAERLGCKLERIDLEERPEAVHEKILIVDHEPPVEWKSTPNWSASYDSPNYECNAPTCLAMVEEFERLWNEAAPAPAQADPGLPGGPA